MFFKLTPTVDEDELEWQIDCWAWLLENLGGLQALREHPTLVPDSSHFPRSGKRGKQHAQYVFEQVAAFIKVDSNSFELIEQEQDVDPVLSTFAIVQNPPTDFAGTYQSPAQSNKHRITYAPKMLGNLERLIALFAHEICHPILMSISDPPPGAGEAAILDNIDYAEEYATDLATVFMGFGIFNGNSAFSFQQYSDTGSGSQGWSIDGIGYLKVHEWAFALAVRSALLDETSDAVLNYANQGVAAGYKRNLKFLERNASLLAQLKS